MDVARFTGGPANGKLVGINVWPPPDEVTMAEFPEVEASEEGVYVKIRQSQLTEEQAASPHLARGAEYQWEPAP